MKKRICTLLAFTALPASFLFAQTSSTPPTALTAAQIVANRVSRLTALLTLTTAQQAQATTLFTNEQTALSPIRTSLDAAHTALQTAIKANDLTGITTQATQIGNLTAQQVLDQAKADAAFYAILTPDQQTKYNDLQSAGFGGPGGMGGPGGGGPGGFRGPGPGGPQ